jgi:hypothetical protein
VSTDLNYAWSRLDRLLRLAVPVIVFIALVAYFVLVTRGKLDLFRPQRGWGPDWPTGFVFNNMLSHLLEGRFDVDPQTIGNEALVHNGRTYAYFGIFPALLRLPLVPFHALGTLPFGQVSCLAAILIGGMAQAAAFAIALLGAAAGPVPRLMLVTLLVAGLYSGPGVMLGSSSSIYDESVLWAWALSVVFVAMAMHGLLWLRRFSTGLLTSMAAVAGCCLLTRASTGMGLFAALGFLLLSLWIRRGPKPRPTIHELSERLRRPRFWAPLLVLAVFAAAAGAVNYGRFGNPLTFADLHEQLYIIANHPDRPSRLDRYGLFDIERLPFGILYYFFPVWNAAFDRVLPLGGRIHELFDRLEYPASSLLLTDPLTSVLAAVGLYGLIRRRIDVSRGPAFAILAGLACPPALMLTAWYMTFRYRAEFAPFMIAAACLGIVFWATQLERAGRQNRIAVTLLVGLCCFQVLSAWNSSVYAGLSLDWRQGPPVEDGAIYYRNAAQVFTELPRRLFCRAGGFLALSICLEAY